MILVKKTLQWVFCTRKPQQKKSQQQMYLTIFLFIKYMPSTICSVKVLYQLNRSSYLYNCFCIISILVFTIYFFHNSHFSFSHNFDYNWARVLSTCLWFWRHHVSTKHRTLIVLNPIDISIFLLFLCAYTYFICISKE